MALSSTATEQLANMIEIQARKWVEEYISNRKAILAKRGILATGGLRDSFAYGLTKSLNAAISNELEVAFTDYGRLVEMKRLEVPRGGSHYIDLLAAWIVKKGLEDKMTRDFMARRKLRTVPPTIINQLAWSVAVSRRAKRRRRSWYNKSKSAAITDLFNRVASNIPDIVLDELKKSF